jgi:oligoendopeptidase F
MLAFSLYQKYRTEGQEFVPRYLAMLTAGGSKSPQELVAPLGVNLEDPAFWQGALRVIEAQVTEFEEMAERALK